MKTENYLLTNDLLLLIPTDPLPLPLSPVCPVKELLDLADLSLGFYTELPPVNKVVWKYINLGAIKTKIKDNAVEKCILHVHCLNLSTLAKKDHHLIENSMKKTTEPNKNLENYLFPVWSSLTKSRNACSYHNTIAPWERRVYKKTAKTIHKHNNSDQSLWYFYQNKFKPTSQKLREKAE